MKKITVGIVDYGIGNQSSVRHAMHELGVRCRISDDRAVLDLCDLLVLPGVGAFQPAIQALRARSLDKYLLEHASRGKPLLGICLGMQLLTESSSEGGIETGLGLVPGEVVSLRTPYWHIGWNTIELVGNDPLFEGSEGQAFYFNHSYAYKGPEKFQCCRTTASQRFAAAIRCDRVVGVQFHPEKSQVAGRRLLLKLVNGLCNA